VDLLFPGQRHPQIFRRLFRISRGVAHDQDRSYREYRLELDHQPQIASLVCFTAALPCQLRLEM